MPVLSAGISPGLLCGVEWATLCLLIFKRSRCAVLSWCAPCMREPCAILWPFLAKIRYLHYHLHVVRLGWPKTHSGCIAHRFWAGSLIANLLALTGGFPLVATGAIKSPFAMPIPPFAGLELLETATLAVCRDGGIATSIRPAKPAGVEPERTAPPHPASLFVDSRAFWWLACAAVTHDVSFTARPLTNTINQNCKVILHAHPDQCGWLRA